MKYLPLIWSSIWRKPMRAGLIVLQIALGFALFGVLQGMKTGVEQAVARVRADVLFVGSAAGMPLPLSYIERLKSLPGVQTVTYADVFLGSYQKPTQPVYAVWLEPSDVWMTQAPEFLRVTPKDLAALRRNRTGALIGTDIARKYGWKIGDHIPIASNVDQTSGTTTWTFDIVGTILEDHEVGASGLIFTNFAYLDEARALNKGTVRNFYVKIADPHSAATMSERIDRMFANSAAETRTVSFKEGAQQEVQQIGNVDFAIRAITGTVLLSLLFSTCTMMMQTIRERTPELALLKTLGFMDGTVFLMVVVEAAALCLTAALLGLGLAWSLFPYAADVVPGLSMPLSVIATALLGAILLALLSVAVPAAIAARLRVADALAGR